MRMGSGIWRCWRSRWPGRWRRREIGGSLTGSSMPAGQPVAAVAEFFGDLQAAGRSEATLRSYGMISCGGSGSCGLSRSRGTGRRGWRPVTSAGGCWSRASRAVRIGVVQGGRRGGAAGGQAYSPSVRAHCETVLRSSTSFTWRWAADRSSIRSRWTGRGGRPGARSSQPGRAVP